MTKPFRIVLVEGFTLVRRGLKNLLESLPNVEVVADVSNGDEALVAVEQWHPSLVVMDIISAELRNLEALSRITHEFPATKVLILSISVDRAHVDQALQRGAVGYLSKAASPSELASALEAIAQGKSYVDSRLSHIVTGHVQSREDKTRARAEDEPEPSPLTQLTSRQREILRLVAEGHSTKEIASLLGITAKTVEAHRATIMSRLRIHNVAGLVRYAVRHGIVAVE